ncbi:MAG: DsrE family protein [Saccharospirillaceae bacterium]|nr:DsrE family protein [Pseudomonadales bacterium]NRB79223.1 DsrE family protein [Saccharospirillaceae bacterium]
MILFISKSAPFEIHHNKELLDMALAAGAFDLNCKLLLQGNAILQLREQHSQVIQQKDINKTLSALPLYDIDPIYVLEQDLLKFAIDIKNIKLSINVINKPDQTAFLNSASKVIRL